MFDISQSEKRYCQEWMLPPLLQPHGDIHQTEGIFVQYSISETIFEFLHCPADSSARNPGESYGIHPEINLKVDDAYDTCIYF